MDRARELGLDLVEVALTLIHRCVEFWITASSVTNSPKGTGQQEELQDRRAQEYPLGPIAQDWPKRH